MTKNRYILIGIAILFCGELFANVSRTVKSYSEWNAAQIVNGDANSTLGQFTIASSGGIFGDEFDTGYLKPYWQIFYANNILFGSGRLRFGFGGGTVNGHNGIISNSFSLPNNFSIEAYVDPTCGGCSIGQLFINGTDPSLTLATASNGQIFYYSNSVFNSSNISGVGACFLKIARSGNALNGYFKKMSNDNWNLICSLVLTSANVADVGFGNGGGAGGGGTAEYDFIRLTPYADQATWTSYAKDLSRTPSTQGTISWLQDCPAGTSIQIQTSTSDDGSNWSAWSPPYGNNFGSPITSTSRQFIRLAATLVSDPSHFVAPVLRQITINYPDATPQAPLLTSTSHVQKTWSKNPIFDLQWSMPAGNPAPESGYTYWVYANNAVAESATVQVSQASVGLVHSRSVTLTVEGHYQINLTVTADAFSGGLTASAAPFVFDFDRTPPQETVITSETHPQLLFANNNSPVFHLNAFDAMSGVSGYAVSLDKLNSGDPGPVINVWGNEKRYLNVENGTYYLHARAIDSAGNTGPVSHYGIRVDFNGALLSDSYVKVLPNPVRGNVAKIEYQLAAAASEVTLEFMGGTGETVLRADGSRTIGKNYYMWDVSKAANGVYFYRIKAKSTEDAKTYSVTKKIAIIR